LPAISAAALAKAESLPVVFISGAPGENEAHEAALHHTVVPAASWRMDYDAALRAFAGLGIRAERLQGARSPGQPNIAAEHFFQLVSHAYLERQPVFIEVPRDLIAGKTQAFDLPAGLAELGKSSIMLTGASSIADDIASKIEAARAPLLLIGDQLKLNRRLLALVHAFTEATGIAHATTWSAKGLVDESSAGCLGSYNGVFSRPEVERYVAKEVDYVLDVASSVYPRESERSFGTDTHILDGPVSRTVLKGTMQHERDLELVFEKLLQRSWTKRTPVMPTLRSDTTADADEVDFHNLADVLNGLQRNDERAYVYVPEVGSSYFASFGLSTRGGKLGRAGLANPWYGAMGTCLPYARVACETTARLGASDRVVVITGDGGFHFQSNELIHFLKERLAVTIVYMRNDLFGLGKCGDSSVYHCSDAAFDVGALTAAYGGVAVRCKNAGAFRKAFRDAGQRGGLTLLEIPCRAGDDRQSRELQLLNLFIRERAGAGRP
jgi:thiamine pyrophosphate-dependent acetolactate synthase large subunit-like protein